MVGDAINCEGQIWRGRQKDREASAWKLRRLIVDLRLGLTLPLMISLLRGYRVATRLAYSKHLLPHVVIELQKLLHRITQSRGHPGTCSGLGVVPAVGGSKT